MRASRRLSGFTLLELMLTVAVSSLVIAGMASTFVSQAQQYQIHVSRQAVQSHSRQGLTFMENMLRKAGYGVDPWLAITPFDSFDAQTNARGLNYPDAVTVLSRDLRWRRMVDPATTSTTELSFTTPLDEPMHQGQILLILGCAASRYAYVTVAAHTQGGSTVKLEAAGPAVETPLTGPGSRFHQQAALTPGTDDGECLVNAKAVVVKVNRHSFFVSAYPERAQDPVETWTPYLMMHQGIDLDESGAIDLADARPIADNVEQLQFSYVLNTTSTAEPIIKGTDPSDAWEGGTAWDVEAHRPRPKASYSDPSRLTDHPANIRQIRATVVTRGPTLNLEYLGGSAFTPDESYAEGSFANGTVAWRQLENLNGALPVPFDSSNPGYLRNTLRMTVATKNLLMRTQFKPVTAGGG